MKMPCEIAVKTVVPAMRALVAVELTRTYELKQTDVGKLLGVTQTAVSKYLSGVRGSAFDIEDVEEIQPIVKKIATSLNNGNLSRYELLKEFCQACTIIRQKGLICEFCNRSDPLIDGKACSFCLSETPTQEPNDE